MCECMYVCLFVCVYILYILYKLYQYRLFLWALADASIAGNISENRSQLVQ